MKRLIALLLCVLLLSASSALADKKAIGTLNINGVFTAVNRCHYETTAAFVLFRDKVNQYRTA